MTDGFFCSFPTKKRRNDDRLEVYGAEEIVNFQLLNIKSCDHQSVRPTVRQNQTKTDRQTKSRTIISGIETESLTHSLTNSRKAFYEPLCVCVYVYVCLGLSEKSPLFLFDRRRLCVHVYSGRRLMGPPRDRPFSVLQWTPLIVATSRPALSGHNNRWFLYRGYFSC